MLAEYTMTTDALSEGEWDDVQKLINYYEVCISLPPPPSPTSEPTPPPSPTSEATPPPSPTSEPTPSHYTRARKCADVPIQIH
jgi:hypothetical protein